MDAGDGLAARFTEFVVGAGIVVMTAIGGAFMRVWRHEERIKALEAARAAEVKALADLSDVVHSNHESTREQLTDAMREIRADLRLIMNRCLVLTHRDNGP